MESGITVVCLDRDLSSLGSGCRLIAPCTAQAATP